MVNLRLLLILLLFCFLSLGQSEPSWLQKSDVCQDLKEFTLKDIDGKKVALRELTEQAPLLFVFWTTYCPYCRLSLGNLIKKAPELDISRVTLVNIGETRRTVQAFLDRFKDNPFTVLLDERGELTSDCKIVGVPTFIIIGKQGNVEFNGNYLPENYQKMLRRASDG